MVWMSRTFSHGTPSIGSNEFQKQDSLESKGCHWCTRSRILQFYRLWDTTTMGDCFEGNLIRS